MSALAERVSLPEAWRRPLIALGLLISALLLLYRDTGAGMVAIWSRSDTFAHAFLVPPISLWLVWRGRRRLVDLCPAPSWVWLIPMLLASVLWLLSKLVAVNAGMQFALVAMIVVSVPLILGWPAARAMLFPLLFLFFCVPVGEFLLPTLMEWTADFTIAALRMSRIPVYREGLTFMIPTGNWSVVEACSGVRYLIASLMVGSLFAYINYRSLYRRLIFVGASIVMPVFANWLRAYMIVMLGHLSNNALATGVDHLVYGWVFFGVVISLMFMVGARWSEPDPVFNGSTTQRVHLERRTMLGGATLAGALTLAWPLAALQVVSREIPSSAPLVEGPERQIGGWRPVASPATSWMPRFENPNATWQGGFAREGKSVGVYVLYYRAQNEVRKLVTSQNVLVMSGDPLWNTLSTQSRESGPEGGKIHFRVSHLVSREPAVAGLRPQLTVWQLHWVDDSFTSSDMRAKWLAAWGLLAGRGDDAAELIIYTEGAPSEGADLVLEGFVRDNLGPLREALRRARRG